MATPRIFRLPWSLFLLSAGVVSLGIILWGTFARADAGLVAMPDTSSLPAVFEPAGMAEVWRVFPRLEGDWLQEADALLRFDAARMQGISAGDMFAVPLHGPGNAWIAVVERAEETHELHVVRGHLLDDPRTRFELRLNVADGRLDGEFERQGRRYALMGRYGYGWIHHGTGYRPDLP